MSDILRDTGVRVGTGKRAKRYLLIFSSIPIIFAFLLLLRAGNISCRSQNLRDITVDAPVDQSLADIFGITSFVTSSEWGLVREMVLQGGKGWIDTDGDGDPDISMFAEENTDKPSGLILVKVIDNDDDMGPDGQGDTDSDTWIADYCADGTVDRVVDYYDFDSDNKVDQMVIYYSRFAHGLPGLIVSVDVGRDHRLFAVSNYQYVQDYNQWESDFNGDEYFAMFYYDRESRTLRPVLEAPFCFYDVDKDGFSEIALRFEIALIPSLQARVRSKLSQWLPIPLTAARFFGFTSEVATLRHSFDIDHDSDRENPHDYDFSISAIGEVRVDDGDLASLKLRNMRTQPVIACDEGQSMAKRSRWKATSLTWDEDGINQAGGEPRYRQRWEGVINRGSEYFPQVGGPPSGEFNKRTEVDQDYSGRMGVYYSAIDRRIHLLGAEIGWMKIDFNYDGRMDMQVRYKDTNGNGIFDRWEVDIDGDGIFDRSHVARDERATILNLDWSELSVFYIAERRKIIRDHERLISAIKELIQCGGASASEAYYLRKDGGRDLISRWQTHSEESRRFYLGIMLEQCFGDLVKSLEKKMSSIGVSEIKTLFNEGRHRELQKRLEGMNGQ